jgi:hypothetical protein
MDNPVKLCFLLGWSKFLRNLYRMQIVLYLIKINELLIYMYAKYLTS